LFTANWRPV